MITAMKVLLWLLYLLFVSWVLLKATASKKIRVESILRKWLWMFIAYNLTCAVAVVVGLLSKYYLSCERGALIQVSHWAVAMAWFVVVWLVIKLCGAFMRRRFGQHGMLCLLICAWLPCELGAICDLWTAMGKWNWLTEETINQQGVPVAFVSEQMTIDASRECLRQRLFPGIQTSERANPKVVETRIGSG